MQFEIDRARGLYRSADVGLTDLPERSSRCIRSARVLYGEILDAIEADGYDVFSRRARVPAVRKAVVVARSLAGR